MTTGTVREVASIPLVSGAGRRVVGVDDAGMIHLITLAPGQTEGQPSLSFVTGDAMAIAADVLAGVERTVTAPPTLQLLATALLAIAPAEPEVS